MADINLIVQLDLPPLPDGQAAFPQLEFAVQKVAQAAHAKWLAYAQGAEPLPGGGVITPRTEGYLKSIQIRQLDTFMYELWSDARHAAAIEYGTAPYDMKQILQTATKVRRSKDGKRYLIIPFQWGTGTGSGKGVTFGRNVMTKAQHAIAQQLAFSRENGFSTRESGNYPGVMVKRWFYQWGSRLNTKAQPKIFSQGMGRHMQGMVKFQEPGTGGSKHTKYLTFRVMSEDSQGWIRPARPGLYPAKNAIESVRAVADKVFPVALETDIHNLLGG